MESNFELADRTYDKFVYAHLIDNNGIFVTKVLFMFIRNLVPNNTIKIENVNNEDILIITCNNVGSLLKLYEKRMNTINELYEEILMFESLNNKEIMDPISYKKIYKDFNNYVLDKLRTYMNTLQITNDKGEPIMWLPENYMGSDITEPEDKSVYEEYIRQKICEYIKGTKLPMVNIIQLDDAYKVEYIINFLGLNEPKSENEIYDYHPEDTLRFMYNTHYAYIFRSNIKYRRNVYSTLMADEFRCIKNNITITPNNSFILSQTHLSESRLINIDQCLKNINYYVGSYLKDLDLSKSFITGSTITASLFNNRLKEYKDFFSSNDELFKYWIDSMYPILLTSLEPHHIDFIRKDPINWNINVLSHELGQLEKNNINIPFKIKSGSDVDIAIDDTVSDLEYQSIVENHFNVIKKYYPFVKIISYPKPKGDFNYVIYTDDPKYITTFRQVELYRSSFNNICSHHVGSVRGCYTSRWSDKPQFYLTASAAFTLEKSASPNYHYFAGRKSNPQDVIIKNLQRGIAVSNLDIIHIIDEYMQKQNIIVSELPFLLGNNVNYSIFNLPFELTLFNKINETYDTDKFRYNTASSFLHLEKSNNSNQYNDYSDESENEILGKRNIEDNEYDTNPSKFHRMEQ